jgi:transcriptional regulator with XRE-family HTH domain
VRETGREPNHQLRAAREAAPSPCVPGAGMSRPELADAVNAWLVARTHRHALVDEHYVARLERGKIRWPNADYRAAFAAVLNRPESALGFRPSSANRSPIRPLPSDGSGRTPGSAPTVAGPLSDPSADDEMAALELARRISASDLGDETLNQLESVVDELATAYPRTAPADLLRRVRQHLGYVGLLIDARMTLAQRRRLMVAGGWLSLLGATVNIDLGQDASATARLRTAASLARHAEHSEIRAWCCETEAWRVLTNGDYRRAVKLSRTAQELAPAGSSAAIQATAQEGRAWSRLGQSRETYDALTRVHKLVAPLRRPDTPEHHYRYDPDKSLAYTATTLAWLGDTAAEGYAREVIHRLAPPDEVTRWPRRVATAHLDLALTLLVTGELDEACAVTVQALASGRVVPSNHWRASEVVHAVEARGLPEAVTVREAYEEQRRG